MSSEKNPNHAATVAVREQWHKIAALLVAKFGKREVTISVQEIDRAMSDPAGINITVRFSDERGIILKLVDDAEADRLANEEGGLPA